MLKNQTKRVAQTAAVAIAALFATAAAHGWGAPRYVVTITNLTKGQIISPAVVASHTEGAERLYVLGDSASPELAKVAEDALLDDLLTELGSSPDVLDVQTIFGSQGPIMPGETASVRIESLGHYRHISLVAMLVTTNDAFVGVSGIRAPAAGTTVRLAPAYDAGTEANTEMCAHIPGPPCGSAEVRVQEGAEGYIYVHPGIAGSGDLLPALHDWRNPVARITIERVKP